MSVYELTRRLRAAELNATRAQGDTHSVSVPLSLCLCQFLATLPRCVLTCAPTAVSSRNFARVNAEGNV